MLKLRIHTKDEDRFGLVLQLLSTKLSSNLFSFKTLEIDSDKDYLYFTLDYHHPRYLNMGLIKLRDLVEIIGFSIEYAFIYTMEEAYTDIDTQSNRNIIYNELK